jgi:hypothetical protein
MFSVLVYKSVYPVTHICDVQFVHSLIDAKNKIIIIISKVFMHLFEESTAALFVEGRRNLLVGPW